MWMLGGAVAKLLGGRNSRASILLFLFYFCLASQSFYSTEHSSIYQEYFFFVSRILYSLAFWPLPWPAQPRYYEQDIGDIWSLVNFIFTLAHKL
jgi:hypothetical protein